MKIHQAHRIFVTEYITTPSSFQCFLQCFSSINIAVFPYFNSNFLHYFLQAAIYILYLFYAHVSLRYKLNASFKLLRYCFQNVIVTVPFSSVFFLFPPPKSSRGLFLCVLLSCIILLPLNITVENYYQITINCG